MTEAPQDRRSDAGPAAGRDAGAAGATVDEAEIARFAAMAGEWWDPRGKFAPLHRLNPARLRLIRDAICRNFGLDPAGGRPFDGLRIVDLGCGGGLICEPMARLGAAVTGIDAGAETVEIARAHAALSGLGIDYRHGTAEALAEAGETFDVVLNLEVVEHVADVAAFMAAAGALVKPGGLQIVATLNRTMRSMALGGGRGGIYPALGAARHPRLAQVPEAVGSRGAPACGRPDRRAGGRPHLQPADRQLAGERRPRRQLHDGGAAAGVTGASLPGISILAGPDGAGKSPRRGGWPAPPGPLVRSPHPPLVSAPVRLSSIRGSLP